MYRRTSMQCKLTLRIASMVDLLARYAQIGNSTSWFIASCTASLMSILMTAFPSGSCKARGRRFCGRVGGRPLLGIISNQPCRQEGGIYGGLWDHQWQSLSCNNGARTGASCLQTAPGAQCFAVAFVVGILPSSSASWLTEKGTPGGCGNVSAFVGGPLHMSETN